MIQTSGNNKKEMQCSYMTIRVASSDSILENPKDTLFYLFQNRANKIP